MRDICAAFAGWLGLAGGCAWHVVQYPRVALLSSCWAGCTACASVQPVLSALLRACVVRRVFGCNLFLAWHSFRVSMGTFTFCPCMCFSCALRVVSAAVMAVVTQAWLSYKHAIHLESLRTSPIHSQGNSHRVELSLAACCLTVHVRNNDGARKSRTCVLAAFTCTLHAQFCRRVQTRAKRDLIL